MLHFQLCYFCSSYLNVKSTGISFTRYLSMFLDYTVRFSLQMHVQVASNVLALPAVESIADKAAEFWNEGHIPAYVVRYSEG